MKTMGTNTPDYWTIITWEFTLWRTAIKGHSTYTTDIVTCLVGKEKYKSGGGEEALFEWSGD